MAQTTLGNMKVHEVSRDYSIDGLSITERKVPTPLAHQVLVRLQAVSLNYRDLLIIKGVGRWRPPAGRVPLSDGVGTIVEAGSDVQNLAVNDRVAGLFFPHWKDGVLTPEKIRDPLGGPTRDGVLQEYVVFDENQVVKVPTYLTAAEAATLPCAALTAWNALIEKGKISADKTVLIQGTGGVALFAAQFSLVAGAQVILLSSSDEKLERARQIGISQLINYKKIPNWEKAVLDLTGGKGVDHVVEVVGGGNINRSIAALASNGVISQIGVIDGLKGEIEISQTMPREAIIQGVQVGSREMFLHMNQAITVNRLHPILHKIYPSSDIKQALVEIEQGNHYGKICISLNPFQ
jgi:NADPH:quinone reductase-like Zn-dependent oxidoreductase